MAAAPWRGIRLFRFVQCDAIPGVREAQLIYIWVSTYKEKRYCNAMGFNIQRKKILQGNFQCKP